MIEMAHRIDGPTTTELAPLVYVVDDDVDILGSLAFSLGTEGYDVRGYESAEAALRDQGETFNAAPKCWVVDYRLPNMDGLDLAVAIRAMAPEVPVLLMTSHPTSTVRARCAVLGIPIIEKPLLNDALGKAIRHALASQKR
ncbi:response regulator [Devosia nitrariae]|uniref:Response regulatory domain-containing protein n=1 Tax=Devosia nitrariae TaxID=2071872 RepID=A0ABQ5W9Q7_9HYPH|nr:response regulator [Devosia nitrariae]GLQ56587.1 hypothetical protein GCM10010862_38460 [Devosia nitrariae]